MVKRLLMVFILLLTPLFAGEQLLFVIHSKKGEFTPPEKKSGYWTLTLRNVDKSVAFFSSIPNRRAGVLEISKFLDLWDHIEKEIHKQEEGAGFVFLEIADSDDNEIPIKILDPAYDDDTDELTFDVLPFDKDIELKQQMLTEITLFIDILNFPIDLEKTDLPADQ